MTTSDGSMTPERREVGTIRELSPENPAQPLRDHIKQLSECGEGLVSIDDEVYWINADDRGVLQTALALWAGPRACEDGALVSRAARALSAVAPRHAELLRDLAARLGFGGGDGDVVADLEHGGVPENSEKSGSGAQRETATLTERLARAEADSKRLDRALALGIVEDGIDDYVETREQLDAAIRNLDELKRLRESTLSDAALRAAAGGEDNG